MPSSVAEDQPTETAAHSPERVEQPVQRRFPTAYQPVNPKPNPSTIRPRAAYYISQPAPLDRYNDDDDNDERIIVRAALYALLLLGISVGTTGVTMLLFRPTFPAFRVNSLAVNNFNVSNSGIKASWDLKIGVENTDNKLVALFGHIGIYLTYGGARLSGTNGTTAFNLGKKEQYVILAHLQRRVKEEQYNVKSSVLEKMAEDRKSGAVSFGLVLNVPITYMIGDTVTSRVWIGVVCKDLKVHFVASRGSGMFTTSSGLSCTSL